MPDPTIWYIDPDTLRLTGGPNRALTGDEWRHQVWPPCPVCGSDIDIDRIEVSTLSQPLPAFIVGWWACPNECDPRRADPRRTVGS